MSTIINKHRQQLTNSIKFNSILPITQYSHKLSPFLHNFQTVCSSRSVPLNILFKKNVNYKVLGRANVNYSLTNSTKKLLLTYLKGL